MSFINRIAGYIVRKSVGTVTHVTTTDPVVALTFDDGPHPEYTPRLLEILKRHGAKATFFMVGEAAIQHPEIVAQVARDGHAIGNHSWDHAAMTSLSAKAIRRQIMTCHEALQPFEHKIFRSPFSRQSLKSHIMAVLMGYSVILYNVKAEDWYGYGAEMILNYLSARVAPGAIILAHDSMYDPIKEEYACRENTLVAIDLFIKTYSSQYAFVTVPELLKHGRCQRVNWYQQ